MYLSNSFVDGLVEDFFEKTLEEEFNWLYNAAEFKDENLDTAVGRPTSVTTTTAESRIAEHMRQQGRGDVHMHNMFPVPVPGPAQDYRSSVDGTNAGDINVRHPNRNQPTRSSQPDVSYVDHRGVRVNLEVDNRHRASLAHQQAHLQAIRAAGLHARDGEIPGMTPAEVARRTRSVFVETDAQGRVTQIREVGYKVNKRGEVIRDRAQSQTHDFRRNPQELQTVLQSGVLNTATNLPRPTPPQNQRTSQARSQPGRTTQGQRSAHARSQQRRSGVPGQHPAQARLQRQHLGRQGNRFDAFEELFSVF